ncbi:MAG: DUF2141 domain-containing protein [Flavisolibacter sp.]
MKHILYLFIGFCALGARAQNVVRARISHFENNSGVCRACLFKDESSFKKGQAFRCTQAQIRQQMADIRFENVPDGQYALFIFHDENNNGVMDRNWLGVPKEGYGASRNKLPFAAAPGFEANSFVLAHSSDILLSIRLRNL